MAINYSCLKCGRAYVLEDAMAGRRARCKQCQTLFTIPAETPPIEEISEFLDDEIATQSTNLPVPVAMEEITDFLPDPPKNPMRAPASLLVRPRTRKPARQDGPPAWRVAPRSIPTPAYLMVGLAVLVGGTSFVLLRSSPTSPTSGSSPTSPVGSTEVTRTTQSVGLEPDELADVELDDRPSEPIHQEAVEQHNQWLRLLANDVVHAANCYEQTRNGGKPDLVEKAIQQFNDDRKKEETLPKINLTEAAIVRKEGGLALIVSLGQVQGIVHREATPSMRTAAQSLQGLLKSSEDYLKVAYPEPPMPKLGLTFRKVESGAASQVIAEKFWALIPPNQRRAFSSGYESRTKLWRVKFGPASDAKALAARIDFATVLRVHGNRIVLEANPMTEAELVRGTQMEKESSNLRKMAPRPSGGR